MEPQDKDKDTQGKHQNSKVEGEGSYTATRRYNERTRQFVESGKTEQAAQDATPRSLQEAQEMREAEREGKAHSKGEDPALHDPSKIPDDPNFPRKK